MQIKNARLKNVGTNFMLIVDDIRTINDVLQLIQRMKLQDKESTIEKIES
jgi:hypothetical protein